MADGAPVCFVSRGQTPFDQRGLRIPAIPAATDLPSALRAIEALKQIVIMLTGQNPPAFKNNLAPLNFTINLPSAGGASGGSAIGSGGGGGKNKSPKEGRWEESNRVTKKVKVTNPDDDSQYVMIERIESLTMEDSVTGEQWVWHRQR